MEIYHSIKEWQQARQEIPAHLNIGFIPTMGNLHIGHMSLVTASKSMNDLTIVSIFINKTQFNNKNDYNAYPRTLNADLKKLKNAGVDYCILPSDEEIYPDYYTCQIIENQQSCDFEGKFRPGHFTGVLTIVMKLFNIVKPQRAYFGEKDYQQLQLIKKMVTAFFMDIEVIACPTIRTANGLAYSSRNKLLSKNDLILANQFAKVLHNGQSCTEIKLQLAALGIAIDYVEDHEQRRFAAVKIGAVRLIDNKKIS